MILGAGATKTESECARLAYSINWQQHAMGIPANWPQSLVSTLSIILNSKFPMFLFWGPDFFCFYNDAYRPSMGNNGKHPGAMGQKGQTVWPEIWEIIHPELEQVMNGGDATWHEDACVPIFRNNQLEDVYWTYSYSPVMGESGEVAGVFVTVTETTKRVLAEKHLINLTSQLKVNEEALLKSNQALAQFAYVASHDLQEPLRMVTSFLAQLAKKYGTVIDDKGRKYIAFAVDGAKRMRQLILDLLEFSRVGRTGDKLESLDLDSLLAEIKILLRKKIEEKKAVITVDKLPHIHAHRSPVRQVFQNLIDNALKYSAQNVAPSIHVSVKDKEGHWEFAVKDNGIGIDKEYFDKIFIIFQRLHNKDEYSGTGIGLAITKKIIENQGGKIWIESEEGKGSTFYFTLSKQ